MKHFMEMDLAEFDKKYDNFSSEDDSLDFDFSEQTTFQEGSIIKDIMRNHKLKKIGYDKSTGTIKYVDDEGKEHSIKLNITSKKELEAEIDAIDKKLAGLNGSDENTNRMKKSLLKMRKELERQIVKDCDPNLTSKATVLGKVKPVHISIDESDIEKYSAKELCSIIEHESEHARQQTRNNGYSESDVLKITDDETLEFIKNFLKSPTGQKLDKEHDALISELAADAAAVRKYGYKTYSKAINKIYSFEESYKFMMVTLTELNRNCEIAHDMIVQAKAHNGEISDDDFRKMLKRSKELKQNLLSRISKCLSDVAQMNMDDKSSIFKKIKQVFINIINLIKDFFDKKKSLHDIEKIIKDTDPKDRKKVIESIYTEEIIKNAKEMLGGNSNDSLESLAKGILEYNKDVAKPRLKFCEEYDKWYKSHKKNLVKEYLEAVFYSEDIYCEEYLLDYVSTEAAYTELLDDTTETQVDTSDAENHEDNYDDNSEEPDSTEVTQEGMFDSGFGNLRSRLADALKGKFKVTNVGPGGMGGSSKFEIMEPDASFDSVKTTVESTGTGCKVVTRGGGLFKCNFTNLPLSQAFEKIKALFEKPELRLESATYDFSIGSKKLSRFSLYQEDGEEASSEGDDLDLPKAPNLDNETEETNVSVETTEGEDGSSETEVDISSFGTDTSDVQNDFDPKDVEILNKLIAAESEAINDYFDASKDTRNEDLRTLFSDIGHEERFHLEQLMYSKSKITGEKYDPRDPEVKAEYEELIDGGMDEDTAASTAIDKSYMVGQDDGDDTEEEKLEQEAAFIKDMVYKNEILSSICDQYVADPNVINKNAAVFIESYIMESIDNVASAPKEVTEIKSPFKLLANGLKVSVNLLSKMSTTVRDYMRKSNVKRARKREWLANHNIADLFKAGIHLYLWNDKTSSMDFETPCKYVDFLYRLTKAIGESCGIKLTAEAKHKTISKPIAFKNVDEGIYKLNQVVFTKSKVVITDDNKATLQNEFFGYNDEKINVKVTHGTDQAINDSDNIYNKLTALSLVIEQYTKISIAVLDELSKLEGDLNSVYYKNRSLYNKAKADMGKVITKYRQFLSAVTSDMEQIIKLDNGLLKLTRERDMTEQSGNKWEGEDIRVAPKKAPAGPQYTKRKK